MNFATQWIDHSSDFGDNFQGDLESDCSNGYRVIAAMATEWLQQWLQSDCSNGYRVIAAMATLAMSVDDKLRDNEPRHERNAHAALLYFCHSAIPGH